MGWTKENRLIARDGGGREGGGGGGGGGVEHVFDVAFLMPVQMSRNTWMGEGEVERSTSATGGSSVVKELAHTGAARGGRGRGRGRRVTRAGGVYLLRSAHSRTSTCSSPCPVIVNSSEPLKALTSGSVSVWPLGAGAVPL